MHFFNFSKGKYLCQYEYPAGYLVQPVHRSEVFVPELSLEGEEERVDAVGRAGGNHVRGRLVHNNNVLKTSRDENQVYHSAIYLVNFFLLCQYVLYVFNKFGYIYEVRTSSFCLAIYCRF